MSFLPYGRNSPVGWAGALMGATAGHGALILGIVAALETRAPDVAGPEREDRPEVTLGPEVESDLVGADEIDADQDQVVEERTAERAEAVTAESLEPGPAPDAVEESGAETLEATSAEDVAVAPEPEPESPAEVADRAEEAEAQDSEPPEDITEIAEPLETEDRAILAERESTETAETTREPTEAVSLSDTLEPVASDNEIAAAQTPDRAETVTETAALSVTPEDTPVAGAVTVAPDETVSGIAPDDLSVPLVTGSEAPAAVTATSETAISASTVAPVVSAPVAAAQGAAPGAAVSPVVSSGAGAGGPARTALSVGPVGATSVAVGAAAPVAVSPAATAAAVASSVESSADSLPRTEPPPGRVVEEPEAAPLPRGTPQVVATGEDVRGVVARVTAGGGDTAVARPTGGAVVRSPAISGTSPGVGTGWAVATAAASPQDRALSDLIRVVRQATRAPCIVALPRRLQDDGVGLEFIGSDDVAIDTFATELASAVDGPLVQNRNLVDPRQCPALDYLQDTDAYPATRLGLQLDADIVDSGGTLSGLLRGIGGRYVALFLVDDNGVVQDLQRFSSFSGNLIRFEVPVTRAGAARDSRQLIIALATPRPARELRERAGRIAQEVFAGPAPDIAQRADFAVATVDIR